MLLTLKARLGRSAPPAYAFGPQGQSQHGSDPSSPQALAHGLARLHSAQLAALVKQAPDGAGWLHEIKLDGYRMATRLDKGHVRLLTRTGLNWTSKYLARP